VLAAPAGILRADFNPIRVDQFGYAPALTKIAVIADPQTGFDAAESYTPGSTIEVRQADDNAVVFSGAPSLWSSGATHDASGDRAWWFDFSSVRTPGEYYLHDPATGMSSDRFRIDANVYADVAVQAMRTFFYQRNAFEKAPPYVPAQWADGPAFVGSNQDPKARWILAQDDASTERDLRGGWFDAGDFNKYTTFTRGTLQDLLLAYEDHPTVWGDNHNIPESGNGIPDILDEIKFELDWLLRMQEPDGSVLSKVAVTQFQAVSPPSADTNDRFYGAASTRSTLTGADIFAHAAIVFGSLGDADMTAYARTLHDAAVAAWDWAEANPNIGFDNSGFGSAATDGKQNGGYSDADDLAVSRARAAAKLLVLTGEATYREYFDAHYRKAHLFAWNFAYVFESGVQDGILYYLRADRGTESVKADIRQGYLSPMTHGEDNLAAHTRAADPYRAHLSTNNYTWGSNSSKSKLGNMFHTVVDYNLDPGNAVTWQSAAAGYLHYLHGTNPVELVYLSNMGDFGAERSVTSFYHNWFTDGSDWDSTVDSLYGPPPGYLTGGPNPSWSPDASYSGPTLAPPADQPAMKSYKDWNTSWPENSWEVTENAIYYQAAYVRLLAAFLDASRDGAPSMINLSSRTEIGAGANAVFPGFVVTGNQSAEMLIRASGPTLADFDVDGTAEDPAIALFNNATNPPTELANNDNWGDFPDQARLSAVVSRVGAFPQKDGSTDAALVATLSPGLYSARTTNVSGESGVALIEVYDGSKESTGVRRMTNLSCRANVGAGDQALIPGIIVSGDEPATLLVRAVGPGLEQFGVNGVLPDPVASLFRSGSDGAVAANNDWQGDPFEGRMVKITADRVGAFALPDGSADAAFLARVEPGSYTVVVRGAEESQTGTALVEVYHVNAPSN